MIINTVIIICLLFLFWIYGISIIRVLKLKKDYRLLTFPAGISAFIIVTNFLYFNLHLKVEIIGMICLIISVLLFGYLIYNKGIMKIDIMVLCLVVVTFAFLIIPDIIGGAQYYTLRGNFYDHFIYLAESCAMKSDSWDYYLKTPIEQLDSITIAQGYEFIFERPAAALGFSILMIKKIGDPFYLAIAYLGALWASQITPIVFALYSFYMGEGKKITKKTIVVILLISSGWIFGFWGQLGNDICAWSQMMTMSILLATIFSFPGLFYIEEDRGTKNVRIDIKVGTLLCVFLAGCIHAYFEGTLVFFSLVGMSFAVMALLYRYKIRLQEFCKLLFIPFLALIMATVPNYSIISKSIPALFNLGYSRKVDWHLYYDRYWVGYWGDMSKEYIMDLKHIPDYIVSYLGYYFITPNYMVSGYARIIWYCFTCGLALFLILLCILAIRKIFKSKRYGFSYTTYLCICGLSGLLLATATILSDRIWTGGKILLWVSALFYVMFFIIIICDVLKYNKKIGGIFLGGLIFLNLYFAGYRYFCATDEDGIGYYKNYPNCNAEYWKEYFSYNFNTDIIPKGSYVEIECEDEPIYMRYMKTKLWYSDINYCTDGNDLYEPGYVDDTNIGEKKPDGYICLENDMYGRKNAIYVPSRLYNNR